MFVTVFVDVGRRAAPAGGSCSHRSRRIPYRRVLGYTYIGYLANNVLPARLGELVRSHSLGEKEGVARTTVLGTVVVERVVDTVDRRGDRRGVGPRPEHPRRDDERRPARARVRRAAGRRARASASRRTGCRARIASRAYVERWPRVMALGRMLREGLAVVARPRTLVGALAFSAVAWSASIGTFLAAGQAVGIELTVAQGALLCERRRARHDRAVRARATSARSS